MSEIAYLSLGSNLGNREANLAGAITILSDQVEIENLKSASFYETEPLYNTDQPLFLNTVLELLTSFSPFELLDITFSKAAIFSPSDFINVIGLSFLSVMCCNLSA